MARTKKTTVRKSEGAKHFVTKLPQKRGTPATGGMKRPHRFQLGMVALHQIWKFQMSTELQDMRRDMSLTLGTVLALQETAEAFLVRLFEDKTYVPYMPRE